MNCSTTLELKKLINELEAHLRSTIFVIMKCRQRKDV